jgi:hypothetical protein
VIRVDGRHCQCLLLLFKGDDCCLFRQIGHLSSQIGRQIGQRADNKDQNED